MQQSAFEQPNDMGSSDAVAHHIHEKEQQAAILPPDLHEKPIAADGFAVTWLLRRESSNATNRDRGGHGLKRHALDPVLWSTRNHSRSPYGLSQDRPFRQASGLRRPLDRLFR